MKFRTRHLVCMMLLLSALRAADGSVLPTGRYGFDSHHIAVLLSQGSASAWTMADHKASWGNGVFIPGVRFSESASFQLDLPSGPLAAYRTAWTMRPPAAHSAAVRDATSFAV
jgi:hypothetical protein